MDQFKAGDVIEHRLMPGFTMTVLDARDCETDSARPEPHLSYNVTDPEGNDDWLCAYDVQKPGEGLPWGAGPRGASFSNGPKWPREVPRPVTFWDFTEGRPAE
jgi:hypothetical protein